MIGISGVLATGLSSAAAATTTTTTASSEARAAAGFRRAGGLLRAARKGAVNAAGAWRELARQRGSLRELDDHLLRDIGLTRSALAVGSRP
jgi:uncharacterized protein YjiS (DUF1127 family)